MPAVALGNVRDLHLSPKKRWLGASWPGALLCCGARPGPRPDLDDAGLPVELDAVDVDLSEPFSDELPADDWAA
jgi:hypothetical protein